MRRLTALSAVAVLLIATALLLPAFDDPGWPQDEGILLVYPERVLKGEIPNRDFEHLYGPGNLIVLAGAYAVSDVSVTVERSVGLAYRLLLVLAVFVLGSKWGTATAASSGLLASILMVPLELPAFGWIGGLALATLGVVLTTSRTPPALDSLPSDDHPDFSRRPFVGGLLSGLALLFRPDLVLAVGLSMIPLVGWVGKKGRRSWAGGAVLGLTPYVLHLIAAGPASLYDGIFVTPVLRVGPGRRLPLPPNDPSMLDLLWVTVGAAALAVVVGAISLRLRRAPQIMSPGVSVAELADVNTSRALLASGLLAVGLIPQALQRADLLHVLFAGCFSISLVPIAVRHALSMAGPVTRAWRSSSALAGAILPLAVLVIALEPAWWFPPSIMSEQAGVRAPADPSRDHPRPRTFPLTDVDAARVVEHLIGAAQHSAPPNSRLFIGPRDLTRTNYNDTYLYYLLPQFEPASYYLEMNPGSANRRGSRLARDLASADLVILTNSYDRWNEPNDSAIRGPSEPLEALRAFCTEAIYGPFELLIPCSRK